MDSSGILLTLGLALTCWILARGLHLTHRLPAPGEAGRAAAAADISAAACAFLAAVFVLKALPLLGPPVGLLRRDFLFPLWALWRRGNGWWWLVPAGGVGLALAAGLAAGRRLRLPAPLALGLLLGAAGVLWLSLSLTNGGWPEGLIEPMIRSADYYVDVDRFASLPALWRDYVARQPELSVHGRTHPPGALTVLLPLDRLWRQHVPAVALSVQALSLLGLLPVFFLARRFLGAVESVAAGILWVLTPSVALYGAVSLDMIFAVPLLLAAALYARALAGPRQGAGGAAGADRSRLLAAGAGTALAVGFLFTFSAAVLAAACAIAAFLMPARRRRTALGLLAVTGVACVLSLGVVALLSGFDPVACLRTAMALDAGEAPAFLSIRYYLLTRLMGVLDFLVMTGVALSPLWLGVLLRGTPAPDPAPADADRDADACLLALTRGGALAVLLFLALGAYKIGETGRIFLFLLPLVIVPVVRQVGLRLRRETAVGCALATIAVWHLAQVLLMEWFLDTRW